MSQPYNATFYANQSSRSLQSARLVLPEVLQRLESRRVIDIGCGTGAWLKAATELGAGDILGVDGSYVDRSMLMIDPARFIAADLADGRLGDVLRGRTEGRFDLVMCLEVAEHLPYERAESLVGDLIELGDAVLFSAAVPFQYGTNHINEQWPEYWAIQFRARGYSCYDWLRRRLWANPDVDWWYAQNALLFVKDGSLAASRLSEADRADDRALALVHPENFLANLLQLFRIHRKRAYNEEAQDLRALLHANHQRETALPPSRAIERARAAGADARDVFPWTRSEIGEPEAVAAQLQDTETCARELVARCAALNEQLAEQTAKREELEERLQGEIARRTAADVVARKEADRAADAEKRVRIATMKRLAAMRWIDAEVARRNSLNSPADPTTVVAPPERPDRHQQPQGSSFRRARRALRAASKRAWWRLKARFQRQFPRAHTARFLGMSASSLDRAAERLRRFLPYVAEDYYGLHPDVLKARADPARHAICFGAFEGRRLFVPERVAGALGSLASDEPSSSDGPAPPAEPPSLADVAQRLGAVAIYASSLGNSFMREIAEHLVEDLLAIGVAAELRDETASPAHRSPISIFVAPHEFFILGQGKDWVQGDVIENAFMLGTEQVQTSWFAIALPFVMMSRGALDMCSQVAELFHRASLPSMPFLPGAHRWRPMLSEDDRRHPLFRVLPAAARSAPDRATAFADRPIDIAFFGTESSKRHGFFAQNAAFLADFNNVIYLRPSTLGPIKLVGADASLTHLGAHVSGHAKITLNIHQDEHRYFEWHRLVRLGMATGSVVVSDPCLPHPIFKPGIHYFEETGRQIPNLLDWLLRSSEGQAAAERVRATAVALIADEQIALRETTRLCDFLLEHSGR